MLKTMYLGKSGLKISVVGIGFWQIGSKLWGFREEGLEKTCLEIVDKAFSYGINFYDTAEIYGSGLSEKYLGLAIRKLGIRDNVVVASKVAGYKYTEESIIKSIKRINERIGFKIDLIQHHWTPPFYASLCKVINTYEKAINEGYVSYYGLSNFNEEYLIKTMECSKKYEPVSNQIQYSLGYRVAENKLMSLMYKYGLTLIAWSPLAKGALSGLNKPSTIVQSRDPVFRKIASDQELMNTLRRIADKYNVPPSTIALAWIIYKKAVPIPGTRKPSRVIEYAKAGEVVISSSDLEELNRVSDKYLTIWGTSYNSLSVFKHIPGFLQSILFKMIGGI